MVSLFIVAAAFDGANFILTHIYYDIFSFLQGFFNKLKAQALEKAREQIAESLGDEAAAMMSSMTQSMGGGGGGSSGGSGGGQQMTTEEYENTKPDELKKDIRMISGCHDKQTSADVSNVSSFQLPDPAGKFISVLWALDLYFYIAIHIICYCLLGCVVEVFALHYCHVHWLVFHIYHLLITNSMHTFIKQVRLAEHAHLLF